MASGLFDTGRAAFLTKLIDWVNDDIRVLLVDDGYVFDATDQFVSDLVASELSATDYARQSITGRTVGAGAPTYALANDALWTGLGGGVNDTIGGAVVFVHTGNDATARVICFCDVGDIDTQDQNTELNFENSRVFSWGG